jgi:mannose-1-phosphate guanylyltransferase
MKKRYSLSIEEGIMKEVDSRIDGVTMRSRSDAVENMLSEQLMGGKKAVILCGGKAESLFIPGMNTYRPFVDIGGKTLIEHIVSKCAEGGFGYIIIVGSLPITSKIFAALGYGEKYGAKIVYVEEKKSLGSAKTLELVKNYIKSDFLFLPCDHYFDFDLRDLYKFHVANNGMVTLGVHVGTSFDGKSGMVEMSGYRITDFEEHPKRPKTYMSSVFVGIMKKEIFSYIPPSDVQWSLQEDIFPKLAKQGSLVGYHIAGDWVNIHSKEDAAKAKNMNKYVHGVK